MRPPGAERCGDPAGGSHSGAGSSRTQPADPPASVLGSSRGKERCLSRSSVPALTAVTPAWETRHLLPGSPCPPVIAVNHVVPRSRGQREEAVHFLAVFGKVGGGNIPDYVAGQKDLPFLFPITSRTTGRALDLQRPRGLAFRPPGGAPLSLASELSQRSGCPGGLVPQIRESCWKGGRDSPRPRPGAALGARRRPTDRRSGAEKRLPRPAGERPLTPGHLWPLLPGAPGRLGRCCTAEGAAYAPVYSAASPPPGKVSLIAT